MISIFNFKRPLVLSVLGHLVLFGLFSFSLCQKPPRSGYAEIYFWGSVYGDIQNLWQGRLDRQIVGDNLAKKFISASVDGRVENKERNSYVLSNSALKPMVYLGVTQKEPGRIEKENPVFLPPAQKMPAIMFYPELPSHFLLYFRDRQMVHMELEFNIISKQKANAILVKRKISSGNLEADLLSMRYISHYLFVQQAAFASNSWQVVKIDLSAKDDQH